MISDGIITETQSELMQEYGAFETGTPVDIWVLVTIAGFKLVKFNLMMQHVGNRVVIMILI